MRLQTFFEWKMEIGAKKKMLWRINGISVGDYTTQLLACYFVVQTIA